MQERSLENRTTPLDKKCAGAAGAMIGVAVSLSLVVPDVGGVVFAAGMTLAVIGAYEINNRRNNVGTDK